MAIERERKFLVDPKLLPAEALTQPQGLTAGYFTNGPVAIRVTSKLGGRKKVCFKGPGTEERKEFEYSIPAEDALELMDLAPTRLDKIRYDYQGWEIDKFVLPTGDGSTKELWIAEWEEGPDKPTVKDEDLPPWIIAEVTDEPEYQNMRLAWRYGKKKEE